MTTSCIPAPSRAIQHNGNRHLRRPHFPRLVAGAGVRHLLAALTDGAIACPCCGASEIAFDVGFCKCPKCHYWATAAGLRWRVTCDAAAVQRLVAAGAPA